MLAAYGLAMLAWSWLRLPETLHPEYRRSLAWRDIGAAAWATIKEPQSRGYTLALTVTFGALTAYIASVQQIVFDAFDAPGAIGLVFGAVFGAVGYAASQGKRDFTSTSQVVASRYDVLCAPQVAEQARAELAKLSLRG